MLTDDQISSRRWRYGCCALEYLYEYVEHEIIASEDKEKWWSKYVQMEFAREVMATTPIGDEDGCMDLEFATRVAAKYDCLCSCPCPSPVKSCVLQEYDADFVVDEMPEDPVDGVYLVKGDGELVTVDDGGEETIHLPVGTVVKVGDTYWIVDANSVHVVFPTLTAVEQSPGWYLVSPVEQVDPQAQLNLQAWNNGWYTVYVGAIPAYVNLNALEMYEGMRAKWVRGECSYYTEVDVDPPLPGEPDAACGPLNNELNMELCYAL